METETIDKLYLEISQFTKARTKREIELENKLEQERDHTLFLEKLLKTLYGDGWEALTIANAKRYKDKVEIAFHSFLVKL